MISAATVYCMQSEAFDSVPPTEFQSHYDDQVKDADSKAYWDAAARVLSEIWERDGEISAGQLFYVSKIYPERVSASEAESDLVAAKPHPQQWERWLEAAVQLNDIFQHAVAGLQVTKNLGRKP